jgi:hypothetical protein
VVVLFEELVFVLVLLAAGLPAAGLAFASVPFAAGLVVDVVVLLVVCFDEVVAVCADAANAMVAATNKSDRFLIVFICLVFFNCERMIAVIQMQCQLCFIGSI